MHAEFNKQGKQGGEKQRNASILLHMKNILGK